MQTNRHDESGFSLVETIVSIGVLTIGTLGLASVFAQGLKSTATSPNELLATQKAAEAIESVYSARDSRTVTWSQVRNVADGGIFLNAETEINLAGKDGILNTGDTGELIESENLRTFKRQIRIVQLNDDLRTITVTIRYPSGSGYRTYQLTSYISALS